MPDFTHEQAYWQQQKLLVAGVDEAGRGPLAGPVVAAAVIFPPEPKLLVKLKDLNDSKKLSEAKREALFPLIQELALDYGIGVVNAPLIDHLNILQATYLAMWKALNSLEQIQACLIDGNRTIPFWKGPQTALVKGDSLSLSIAAASVLAKVTRDRIMLALEETWPGYEFARHKGYPTTVHTQNLK
ncbi:ribonuclease HII, partial [bacterium (Candidatus Blackallbacteria) CG13_big_fil_rev_8_21_14_2_50_49_14]